MKNQNQFQLLAKKTDNGINIYLNASEKQYYLVTRRSNKMLWKELKDGISLGDLRRIKPQQNRDGQLFYNSSRYLLKVVDDFLKYELAA